ARAGPLDTESAILCDALRPRTVAKDVGVRIHLVRGQRRLLPVEVPGAVGACRHAAAAPDAPVVVDDDDPVGLLPGLAGRAGLGARRLLALLAGHGHVEVAGLRNLGGVVVGIGV